LLFYVEKTLRFSRIRSRPLHTEPVRSTDHSKPCGPHNGPSAGQTSHSGACSKDPARSRPAHRGLARSTPARRGPVRSTDHSKPCGPHNGPSGGQTNHNGACSRDPVRNKRAHRGPAHNRLVHSRRARSSHCQVGQKGRLRRSTRRLREAPHWRPMPRGRHDASWEILLVRENQVDDLPIPNRLTRPWRCFSSRPPPSCTRRTIPSVTRDHLGLLRDLAAI
jgi:hypothetical protein